MRRARGFTLVELLVVMAVVALLLSLATPRYLRQVDHAREAALRQNLAALRLALDQYFGDKGRYPERLEQLVDARYLRRLPEDPMTHSAATWQVVVQPGQPDASPGIVDVHSGAAGLGSDGTEYGTW